MFSQVYGEEKMAVRVEGRPLHTCVMLCTSVDTSVLKYIPVALFTATMLPAIASRIVRNRK